MQTDKANLIIVNLLSLGLYCCVSYIVYTNIRFKDWDFSSYLFMMNTFREGVWNYKYLHSHNGPCNYPAGFVYIHYLLYEFAKPTLGISDSSHTFKINNY